MAANDIQPIEKSRQRALRSDAGKPRVAVSDRFWAKVGQRSKTECWPWLGWKQGRGYGRFKIGARNWLATHVMLSFDGRPRPHDEAVAMHSCDNPSCVNPAHLIWGSVADNNADRDAKGRHVVYFGSDHWTHKKPALRVCGERHGQSKLTKAQAGEIKASKEKTATLAKAYSVSETTVQRIRSGKLWTSL